MLPCRPNAKNSSTPVRPARARRACRSRPTRVWLGLHKRRLQAVQNGVSAVPTLGQRERVDQPVAQVLADAIGYRGLFQDEVVVDGLVSDDQCQVAADDRGISLAPSSPSDRCTP